jgi:phosphatidylglycerophosphatase A
LENQTWGDRLWLFLATGCGVGYIPRAPGTFGSLAALLVVFGLKQLPATGYLVATVLVTFIGVPLCSRAARLMKVADPGSIVFDELAGMLWTFAFGVPFHWLSVLAGFLLFRLLDISKPPPVRNVERFPAGWGIMADDVVAGFIAGGLLWGLQRLGLFSIANLGLGGTP